MSFSQEASKKLKGIPCYRSKLCKSLPEHLILPSILPGCLRLSSSRLYSRTRQYPTKEHLVLSVCPDFVLSRIHLKFFGKNTPQNYFFTEQLPVAAFKCQLFFLKRKNKTFLTSSELNTLKIL